MNGEKGSNKLWDIDRTIDKNILEFTVGNDYLIDLEILPYDCTASIAHAKMLKKLGILTEKELEKTIKELQKIIELHKEGKFIIKQEEEDCHTAIENYLTNKLGDTGKKIHTFRSRNDQVLTALRLYYKDKIKEINNLIDSFILTLKNFIKKYGRVKIPGYTHTRQAMPTDIKTWSECWIDSMRDNKKYIRSVMEIIDQSPLGAGAGFGTPIKIDRDFTAIEMGFKKVQKNPIYCINSRGKFEAELLSSLAMIMFDINKIASDIIFYSTDEIGIFRLDKRICTGSSIMPHKRNPDVFEILRANYHVVNSLEFQIKSLIANLISGYHRDFQLQKEAVIKGLKTTINSLSILNHTFNFIEIDKNNAKRLMSESLYSVEKAYRLTLEKNIPFRDAYKIIKKGIDK